jgi:hypothetical protein
MTKSLRCGFSSASYRKKKKVVAKTTKRKNPIKKQDKFSKSVTISLDEKRTQVTQINGLTSDGILNYFPLNLVSVNDEDGSKEKLAQMSPMKWDKIETTKMTFSSGKSVKLPAKVRKNLLAFLKNQEQIAKCGMFRCYAFVSFLLDGKFPFCQTSCSGDRSCKYFSEFNSLEKLTSTHIAENFTVQENFRKFRVGDIVVFGKSCQLRNCLACQEDPSQKYGFTHFAIDMGQCLKGDDRLCLSKLGNYSDLYLTTYKELQRMYDTDGKMMRLVPKLSK